MSCSKPPQSVDIALFGKKPALKNRIGNAILTRPNAFNKTSNGFDRQQNASLSVISTPDFFDEDCEHPDQLNIDFMARSCPGPRLFVLAIGSENSQVDEVTAQITKLQDIFGERVTDNLAVVLEDDKSYSSLHQLEGCFKIELVPLRDGLAGKCETLCHRRVPFHYDYKHYSQTVVRRRRDHLKRTSDSRYYPQNKHGPLQHHSSPGTRGMPDGTFSIVLLGHSGTGKSASGNTILAAGNPHLDRSQLFKTYPSSTAVTTKCEAKMVEKFGTQIRVVDTPDFFDDDECPQAPVEECKTYCQPGQCVVLLVTQLGRFTEGENRVLYQLEEKLGWRLRESTIVLLTHGDDFKGHTENFIGERSHLKNIIGACGQRYHVFNNNSKDSKQVTELIKKIPNYQVLFPNFTEKSSQCCLC